MSFFLEGFCSCYDTQLGQVNVCVALYIFVWTLTTSSSPRHQKWCWGGLKCTWVQLGESLKSGDRGAECLAREGEDRGGAKHGYGDITGLSPFMEVDRLAWGISPDEPWDTITQKWPLWWEIPTTGYGSTVLCQDVPSKYIIWFRVKLDKTYSNMVPFALNFTTRRFRSSNRRMQFWWSSSHQCVGDPMTASKSHSVARSPTRKSNTLW